MGKTVAGLLIVVVVIVGALYYADQRLNQMYDAWYTGKHTGTRTQTRIYPKGTSELYTLNGTIRSIHGDQLTREFWVKMKEYNTSDPRIHPYIQWLRWAFDDPSKALNVRWYPRYHYWWFNNRYGWDGFPNTTLARIGRIQLPYGATLIVTALPDQNGVDVVVHGTLTDPTSVLNLTAQSLIYMTSNAIPPDFFHKTYNYARLRGVQTDWVLWRIEIDGHGSSLVVDGADHPIRKVYLLLEMPVYVAEENTTENGWNTKYYLWEPEYLYWVLLGYPAFGLAFNLAYPPNYDVWSIYRNDVNDLIHEVFIDTGYCGSRDSSPYPYWKLGFMSEDNIFTTFMFRAVGCGVCEDHSEATTMLASVMGVYSSVVILPAYGMEHALSVLVLPSSVGLRGPVKLGVDVDGDGVPDTGDVIVDTGGLSDEYINENIEEVWMYPPLQWRPVWVELNEYTELPKEYQNHPINYLMGDLADKLVRYRTVGNQLAPFWTGILPVYRHLPAWLSPPWMGKLPRKMTPWRLEAKAKELLDKWASYDSGTWVRSATADTNPVRFARNLLNGYDYSFNPTIKMNMSYWTRVFMLILENKTSVQLQTPPSVSLALRGATVDGEPLINYIPVIESFLPKSIQYS